MDRVGDDARAGLQQARRLRIEEVGVAAHFVHRPVDRLLVEDERQRIRLLRSVLSTSSTCVRQIMWWNTKRPPTVGVGRARRAVDVVDFLDLERGDVAIFGEPGRDARNLAPPVGRAALHGELLRLDDQIRRADRPRLRVGVDLRRRHVGRVAARRAAVGPLGDRGDLVVAQRRIVVELLDADVLLDVPRRHHAGLRADAGALLDRARPRPHVLVGDSDIGATPSGAMAVLAAALQDGRDVLREGHGAAGTPAGARAQSSARRDATERRPETAPVRGCGANARRFMQEPPSEHSW